MTYINKNKNFGFSLVELSIVLLIIGLLTGGILAGKSLIRAAELRNITTESNKFVIAVNIFKEKYFALPGDITNATAFWGSANGASCNASETTVGTGTQTCNGDGDGKIEPVLGVSRYSEQFMFWQHLGNAGLIQGNYTGMAGATIIDGYGYEHMIGINSYTSKISNATYMIETRDWTSGSSSRMSYDYVNSLHIGALILGRPTIPIITPEEAWNIDKKTDDGLPGTGSLLAVDAGCINGSLTTPTTTTYRLSGNEGKEIKCALAWFKTF